MLIVAGAHAAAAPCGHETLQTPHGESGGELHQDPFPSAAVVAVPPAVPPPSVAAGAFASPGPVRALSAAKALGTPSKPMPTTTATTILKAIIPLLRARSSGG
jgi:hypothetical protein